MDTACRWTVVCGTDSQHRPGSSLICRQEGGGRAAQREKFCRHPAAGLQGSGAPHASPVAFYRGTHTALQIEYPGCNKLKMLSNIPVLRCIQLVTIKAAAKAYNACDWGLLQAAAKFTPLQRQQLIALRAKFLRDIDEVVAERRMLTQGIKVTAFALKGVLLG